MREGVLWRGGGKGCLAGVLRSWWSVACCVNTALVPLTAEVLSEEPILKWYKDAHLAKGKSVFLEQMKKFVEWLKNAEEGNRLLSSPVELVRFGTLSAVMLCFGAGGMLIATLRLGVPPSTGWKSLPMKSMWIQ